MNLDLNTSPALPSSDEALAGATAGSMGDLSKADLRRGYGLIDKALANRGFDPDAPEEGMADEPEITGGFAGRPEGWER